MIKKRFPHDSDLFRRIRAMLPVFYLINMLGIQCLYMVYEQYERLLFCPPYAPWNGGLRVCLPRQYDANFVNEAAAGWDKWKISVIETGRLQNAYQKSRLLSLKRQINPHFLYNCFNTLSSLISEDADEAEQFSGRNDKSVPLLAERRRRAVGELDEELRFINAYLYLNLTRFGSALRGAYTGR